MQKDYYQPLDPQPINDQGEQIDGTTSTKNDASAEQKQRGWFASAAPALASAATGAVAGFVLGRRSGR